MNIDKLLSKNLQESLHDCLTKPIDWFRQFGESHETPDGPAIYKDNGAKVLGVAHLDYVYFCPPVYEGTLVKNCPQLDDRLGVWVLMFLLPEWYPDFKFDLLLCDSEEIGQSTGQHHPKLQDKIGWYNWGFEFDRAGTDLVTYDYGDTEWDKCVEAIAPIGMGAFSDISYLEFLGCKMMNVGVGYHKQHTQDCFADLNNTVMMVNSFARWAFEHYGTKFPHVQNDYNIWEGLHRDMKHDDQMICSLCQLDCDDDQLLCYDCQLWAISELQEYVKG